MTFRGKGGRRFVSLGELNLQIRPWLEADCVEDAKSGEKAKLVTAGCQSL